MKKAVITFIIFILFCYGNAEAVPKIVVVQGMWAKPYEDAIQGFKKACPANIVRLVLSEQQDYPLVETIHSIRPDAVFVLGKYALSKVKEINDIPIVYGMLLNPESILGDEKNISGVSMEIPFEKQLFVFMNALPNAKKIGILYDPSKTGYFLENAEANAQERGIELIMRKVQRSNDVPKMITDMKGKIDAFWMLPDTTVINSETVEFLLLFSMTNKIPLLTFSEKYVDMGAFVSMNISSFDIGSQAGEMAAEIISGTGARQIPRVYARKAEISTNVVVAAKFGILNVAGNGKFEQNGNVIKNSLIMR